MAATGQHYCASCRRTFKRRFTWRRHMDTVHVPKDTYTCTIDGCNMRFKRRDVHERHKSNQHGISKVECPDCGNRIRRDALQEHQQGAVCQYTASLREGVTRPPTVTQIGGIHPQPESNRPFPKFDNVSTAAHHSPADTTSPIEYISGHSQQTSAGDSPSNNSTLSSGSDSDVPFSFHCAQAKVIDFSSGAEKGGDTSIAPFEMWAGAQFQDNSDIFSTMVASDLISYPDELKWHHSPIPLESITENLQSNQTFADLARRHPYSPPNCCRQSDFDSLPSVVPDPWISNSSQDITTVALEEHGAEQAISAHDLSLNVVSLGFPDVTADTDMLFATRPLNPRGFDMYEPPGTETGVDDALFPSFSNATHLNLDEMVEPPTIDPADLTFDDSRSGTSNWTVNIPHISLSAGAGNIMPPPRAADIERSRPSAYSSTRFNEPSGSRWTHFPPTNVIPYVRWPDAIVARRWVLCPFSEGPSSYEPWTVQGSLFTPVDRREIGHGRPSASLSGHHNQMRARRRKVSLAAKSERMFLCPLPHCSLSPAFSRRDNLERHIKKAHPHMSEHRGHQPHCPNCGSMLHPRGLAQYRRLSRFTVPSWPSGIQRHNNATGPGTIFKADKDLKEYQDEVLFWSNHRVRIPWYGFINPRAIYKAVVRQEQCVFCKPFWQVVNEDSPFERGDPAAARHFSSSLMSTKFRGAEIGMRPSQYLALRPGHNTGLNLGSCRSYSWARTIPSLGPAKDALTKMWMKLHGASKGFFTDLDTARGCDDKRSQVTSFSNSKNTRSHGDKYRQTIQRVRSQSHVNHRVWDLFHLVAHALHEACKVAWNWIKSGVKRIQPMQQTQMSLWIALLVTLCEQCLGSSTARNVPSRTRYRSNAPPGSPRRANKPTSSMNSWGRPCFAFNMRNSTRFLKRVVQ